MPDQQVAKGETLEQIAKRLVNDITSTGYERSVALALSALRNERERAVRIIDEHQALDVCEDNCWTTIKAAIREGR